MSYIVEGPAPTERHALGGKAAALAALGSSDIPIPPWFAVTPAAFYASLPGAQQALDATRNIEEIQSLLHDLGPSSVVTAAIEQMLGRISPAGQLVAVRSSAIDEDGLAHSFAGQLDTHLCVSPQQIDDRVAAVWRSGFSEQIIAYRRAHNLPLLPAAPAVLIQRMVQPDVSGVAFSADPVTGRRDVAVVAAIYGLGTTLVSGECDADMFHVDGNGSIISRAIAHKNIAHRADPDSQDGIAITAVPSVLADQPALTDEQVQAVADLVRRASQHFGCPQDIEWAIEGQQLYLLQSRPITSLGRSGISSGPATLWDNSNIVESYGGITTPLTFSFARKAYEEVYRQFCRILLVPEHRIADNSATFANMLGLINGRIYYNLLSWYTALALLPGFASNHRFMEQMMGVREGLPDQIAQRLATTRPSERLKDQLNLLRMLGGLISNHLRLQSNIQAFYQRLNDALHEVGPQLASMQPEELAAHYRDLERRMLSRWDAPLINDFFCMIFFGVLLKLTQTWCNDQDGGLHNNLLCGQGGMISAEPPKRLAELAALAADDPQFAEALTSKSLGQILQDIQRFPQFQRRYLEYIEQFGDRCLEELKLESATLHDDPLMLLRSIGQYAQRRPPGTEASQLVEQAEPRKQAEKQARTALSGHPVRTIVFNWVLKHARARVRDRENLRFERTRLFGRVRRIFLEIGRRFQALELLDDPRDIFYLEVHEALGFIEGTSTTTNLKGLTALRKAEFAGYHDLPAPDSRFQTYGIVNHGNTFVGNAAPSNESGEQRQGIGCCPGRAVGRARVISDPRNARIENGDILVAERTDPGWILLFPCAAGVLVERGSLLSHSAIVARELNIPTVVSLVGATTWLKDGDWVELDGATGIVRRIPVEQELAR